MGVGFYSGCLAERQSGMGGGEREREGRNRREWGQEGNKNEGQQEKRRETAGQGGRVRERERDREEEERDRRWSLLLWGRGLCTQTPYGTAGQGSLCPAILARGRRFPVTHCLGRTELSEASCWPGLWCWGLSQKSDSGP